MIDLSDNLESFDITLLGDIKVKSRPLTTGSMLAAQTAAQRRVREIVEPYEKCKEAGLIPAEVLDLDITDPDNLEGLRIKFLIEEIANRHIISWENVYLNGKPAPVEPEMIASLMAKNPIGQTFYHQITIKQVESFIAKKDGGIAATGTSVAVPTTARAAGMTTRHVPEVSGTTTASSARTQKTTSEVTKKSLLGDFWDFFRVR